MSWLKINTRLSDNPHVRAIAQTLGITPEQATGHLIRVWSEAENHTTTGEVPSGDFALVDAWARFPGFADAMQRANWLVKRPKSVEFPNWDKHNSEGAKARFSDVLRKRKTKNSP